MEDLLARALSAVGSSVLYAEARIGETQRFQHLAVQNGEAKALTASESSGIGVRVRTNRSWGFATGSSLNPSAVRDVARLAVRAARAAQTTARESLSLTSEKGPDHGTYQTPFERSPFEVPTAEKIALLTEAEKRLHAGPTVKTASASMQSWEEVKWYANTEGANYRSRVIHVGAGVQATAISSGDVQRRSRPTSFGGDFAQGGYECIERLDLPSLADVAGREAVELLAAPRCPRGRTTLVVGSDQLALQIHESVGHATELDRIFGYEAGFAGTSWVSPSAIGHLRYGSPLMNIVADAQIPGGLGTFGWDDEGTPARRVPIIEEGRLVGALSSRETAARAGLPHSGGAMRAEASHRMPLVRMTNVNMEPGDQSLPEILEGIDAGIYVETNRSWSIDDQRLNFQFGTELGRRIVKGEIGPLVRNPIYSGMTPTFWNSLDAVGRADTWRLWGVPNCGKGQPTQTARVGHGAPVARFRHIDVRGD